jgi:tetratricopeptide (TPR) repeat protein
VALAESFAALAQRRPLLLCLDDLHLADELTLGFVDFLLRSRRLAGWPVLVAGTYRTEELGPELGRILQSSRLRHVTLGPLDEEASASMLAEMLALPRPPRRFGLPLASHAGGNPLLLTLELQSAVDDGRLRRDAEGRWHAAPQDGEGAAPGMHRAHTPDELAGRRLQGLSAAAVAAAAAAAVLGGEAAEDLLGRVSELEPDAFLSAGAELLRSGVLEEGEGGRLRFPHEELLEAAYRRIGPRRRRRLHRVAAEQLRAGGRAQGPEALAALGQHWERAGNRPRARVCFLEAARAARRLHALQAAEWLYRAHLACLETASAEGLASRIELSREVLGALGRWPEAVHELERAVADAEALGDRAHVGLASCLLGGAQLEQGEAAAALGSLDRALAAARESGDRRLEARALLALARLRRQQGRPEAAHALYERVLELAGAACDRAVAREALEAWSRLAEEEGDLEWLGALHERIVRLARQGGEPWSEGKGLAELARLRHASGEPEAAQALYVQALEVARRIGARALEAVALAGLAELDEPQGRLEDARACCEAALAAARDAGDVELAERLGRQSQRLRAGAAEPEAGHSSAELMAEHAAASRRLEALTWVVRASLERRTGDAAQAQRLLGQAESVLRDAADTRALAVCLCERGHLVLASGLSARDLLEQVEALSSTLAAGAGHQLEQAIPRLRRAVEAFEAGGPLLHGERLEDLPDELRAGP